MPSAQRGNVLVYLLMPLLVAALIIFFIAKVQNQKIPTPLIKSPPIQTEVKAAPAESASPAKTPIITSVATGEIYTDSSLKFQFSYPNSDDVVSETEDAYSKRTETDYRKNFTDYMRYAPPKFVTSVIIKPKTLKLGSSQFDIIPLTIWVFENPQNLSPDTWYKNYWYYPFVWGIFVTAQKNAIAPQTDTSVSGVLTKSAVVGYSPGKPEFILVPKGDKMFLFKVMAGGEQTLQSFKFD